MRIGKIIKIKKIPDAIPIKLPKVTRINVPNWPVKKEVTVDK